MSARLSGLSHRTLALLVLLVGSSAVRAQEAPSADPNATTPPNGTSPVPADLPLVEQLQARIAEVEADTALDENAKKSLLEQYNGAVNYLKDAQRFQAKEKAFQDSITTAPAESTRIREQLKQEPSPPAVPPSSMKSSEIDGLLVKAQADATAARNAAKDLDGAIKANADRPENARQEQATANDKIQQIDESLATAPPPTESPALTEARKWVLRARRLARTQELRSLEQELLSLGVRQELLKAQKEAAVRQIVALDQKVKVFQEALNEAKRREAEEARTAAEVARREAIGKHPAIRRLAEENAGLSQDFTKVTSLVEKTTKRVQEAKERRERIETDDENVRTTLAIVGVSDTLGQFLRRQRRSLPDLDEYRANAAARQESVAQAGLSQFSIEERYRARRDTSVALQTIIDDEVDDDVSERDRNDIAGEVRTLLESQRDLVDKLLTTYVDYRHELDRLDGEEKALVQKSRAYASFLDEKLLWVPNLPPIGENTVHDLPVAVGWLISAKNWIDTWKALVGEAKTRPVISALIVLLTGILFLVRRRLNARLHSIAKRVGKVHTDKFLLSIEALVLTYLMAIAPALPMAYAGKLLSESLSSPTFARAVGYGLLDTAKVAWVLLGTSLLLSPDGMGRVHFRWSESAVNLVRRNLFWFGLILLPANFFVTASGWDQTPPETESLGRLAFVVAMLGLAIFVQRILRPKGGLVERFVEAKSTSWIWQLRYVWYPCVIALPVVAMGLAANGYYYSSFLVTRRFFTSIGVVVGVILVRDLVLRWFFVARNKLALAKALKRREAQQAAPDEKSGAEGVVVLPEEPEMTLSVIDEQVRSLLGAFVTISLLLGIWLVWEDVIPALGILREIHLWPYTVVVDGAEVLKPVTLADLAMGVIIGLFTMVSARNLPALLEVAVLRHLPLDAGSRYAFTTVGRYGIVALGLAIAMGAIGIGWAQFRWIIAPLGLGLGFGLQEIFANLVSGIMILFERPFRVGDVVTVGGQSGVVSRIRIRATTIIDWDRKELVIPNKTFITEQLLNWTLSDQITRLLLKVGVAYGSDTVRAHKIMLETVQAHPLILDDPAPSVYFMGFGESSLDFEIRIFVKRMDERLPVLHEVNTALNRALAENGIEIPFPQRDLHVRSIRAGLPILRDGEGSP